MFLADGYPLGSATLKPHVPRTLGKEIYQHFQILTNTGDTKLVWAPRCWKPTPSTNVGGSVGSYVVQSDME